MKTKLATVLFLLTLSSGLAIAEDMPNPGKQPCETTIFQQFENCWQALVSFF